MIGSQHRSSTVEPPKSSSNDDPAVGNLRNYLKIRSVHPNVNYDECVQYLRGQAQELGLPVQVFQPLPKKPVVVMTWAGQEPALPSVLLNSHMDVVPVFENSWSHPPFAADLVEGVIYARGIQDMKSVAVQYLEAVRRLKSKGVQLKRTVHLSFVPDEEIGGRTGMAEFVKTQDFKNLNVGFALDEGIASHDEGFLIFNGERTIYHAKVTCPGKSGHGALLLPDNSGEKIRYIIDQFMNLRADSKKKMQEDPTLNIGDVTSVNLTMLSGGIQDNVVPEKLTANFDVRLALSFSPTDFEALVSKWCSEAGDGVSVEYLQRDPFITPTVLDDSNLYWKAFKGAADKLNLTLKPGTFPAGTDSRFLREKSIPALGFSPMSNTLPGLHVHDERLSVDVFLRGIQIYEALVPAVANVSKWCSEAGDGVSVEYLQRDPFITPTVLDDSNLYWKAFKGAADKLNITLKPRTFPGGTDSSFLREKSIPALGFSPMSNTVPGPHEHDERLGVDVFLRGIQIYEALVPAVANV